MTPRAVLERLRAWALRQTPPPPRPGGSRGAGWDWERVAEKRLVAEGFVIVERNFRSRAGEIDFVAEENGILCFVEVKARGSARFGSPAEAVNAEKQRRIFRAAEAWLAFRERRERTCRFDVVAICGGGEHPTKVEILRDAFRGPPRRRRRR